MSDARMLEVLQHALGLDEHSQGESYRRHFVTGPGSDDFAVCEGAVQAGRMERRPPSSITGGNYCYLVTDTGRAYVREHSPQPPKLTRSQRTYRAWLNADSGLTFGEWLRRRPAGGEG